MAVAASRGGRLYNCLRHESLEKLSVSRVYARVSLLCVQSFVLSVYLLS